MLFLLENAEKTVDCQGSQVLNKHEYKRVLRQRRLMALATFGTFFGILLLIIAVLMPNWANIDFVNTKHEHVNVQLGVWGEYRTVNTSKKVEWISHFPEPASDRFSRLAGVYLKHYYRVQAAFSIIALSIMVFANGMAIYSFSHHRYMFKRVVGLLFLIIAMCIVVTIEVLINSMNEWNLEVVERSHMPGNWDYSSGQRYGYPVYMAWTVVGLYLLGMFAFLHASHKQKGNRAATSEFEIEDRPVHIGRL
ncbi:hypothetical protein niasHT_030853 [Heterodera trifolii]|uniref:Uncharacterized protein n=1 Tax=Heterodera trifolii TaxID=157864 RepID=A0ABD2HQS1_9BILA